MVLKKFTMFECDTICLLYLLNCMFTEVGEKEKQNISEKDIKRW